MAHDTSTAKVPDWLNLDAVIPASLRQEISDAAGAVLDLIPTVRPVLDRAEDALKRAEGTISTASDAVEPIDDHGMNVRQGAWDMLRGYAGTEYLWDVLHLLAGLVEDVTQGSPDETMLKRLKDKYLPDAS